MRIIDERPVQNTGLTRDRTLGNVVYRTKPMSSVGEQFHMRLEHASWAGRYFFLNLGTGNVWEPDGTKNFYEVETALLVKE